MKRTIAVALFFAGTLAAATCPFNMPVVTIPPQQVAGFVWGSVIQPMGDACVGSIAVDPANDLKWYVGGINGLYMTNDGGLTWTHPLGGDVNALLLVPGNPTLVYVGIGYPALSHARSGCALDEHRKLSDADPFGPRGGVHRVCGPRLVWHDAERRLHFEPRRRILDLPPVRSRAGGADRLDDHTRSDYRQHLCGDRDRGSPTALSSAFLSFHRRRSDVDERSRNAALACDRRGGPPG